jgi:hypothetical protein
LLPFLEHYSWGHECHTSVIMALWPTHTSIQDITTKYPKPAKLTKWLVIKTCRSDSLSKTFDLQPFSQNTSHSHDNLRRVSKSPLLHPFTHRRSGTLDCCVMRATSADSSRLIHSILAHSSTLLHYIIFQSFVTIEQTWYNKS